MEIKVGAIGRITVKDSWTDELVVVLGSEKNYKEELCYICYSSEKDVTKFTADTITAFTRAKLNAETRELYKEYYKEFNKQQAMQKTADELRKKITDGRFYLAEISKRIDKSLDVISYMQVKEIPIESGMYARCYKNDKETIIELTVNKDIMKYATPSLFGFIDEEYDRSYHIGDRELAIKEVGLVVPDSVMQEIQKVQNHMKLIKTEKHVELGDKDWLSTNVDFVFTVKKSLKWSDVEAELKQIVSILGRYQLKVRGRN